jgi:lipoyl(octanoyl) transferase
MIMQSGESSQTTRTVALLQPGRMPYDQALAWQRRLSADRSAGITGDSLIILEHPETITFGNRARPEHILVDRNELQRRGVALIQSDRGGDVTYHAPGQIVGYPILKLSRHGGDLGRYMRNLEEVILRTLADYGISGERIPGLTGVWVAAGTAKICAIGVKLSSSGVTSHGFALNVAPDIRGFDQIVPCGIHGRAVTSLERLLGTSPTTTAVTETLLQHFQTVFDVDLVVGTYAMEADNGHS